MFDGKAHIRAKVQSASLREQQLRRKVRSATGQEAKKGKIGKSGPFFSHTHKKRAKHRSNGRPNRARVAECAEKRRLPSSVAPVVAGIGADWWVRYRDQADADVDVHTSCSLPCPSDNTQYKVIASFLRRERSLDGRTASHNQPPANWPTTACQWSQLVSHGAPWIVLSLSQFLVLLPFCSCSVVCFLSWTGVCRTTS